MCCGQCWLGTHLGTLHCPRTCPVLGCSVASMVFQRDPAYGSVPGFASFRERLQEQELGEKIEFADVLISKSCSLVSLPTVLMDTAYGMLPHCPSNAQETQESNPSDISPSRGSLTLGPLGSLAEPLHLCKGCVSPLADEPPCPSTLCHYCYQPQGYPTPCSGRKQALLCLQLQKDSNVNKAGD